LEHGVWVSSSYATITSILATQQQHNNSDHGSFQYRYTPPFVSNRRDADLLMALSTVRLFEEY